MLFFFHWGFAFVSPFPFFTVSSLTLIETTTCCFLRTVSSSCDTLSLILLFLTQLLCCSNSSPFFHFFPFLHQEGLGDKDPNTHVPAKDLVWSPPNILVKTACPTGCGWAFGPASAVETRTSSLHGGEGLETNIFLRLLRRSHLPSIALLSHTHIYIWVTLYIWSPDISAWI